jgi:NAD+ kinase
LTQTRDRTVFLLAHTGRPAAIRSAELVVEGLVRSGLGVRVLAAEAANLPLPPEVELIEEATAQCLDGCELLIVLGGDGTLLRGAEFARASGVPMLGVNLGSVGFLAEAERDDLDKVVDRVVTKSYEVEERMTIDVVVHQNGNIVHTDWALNEAAVQKVSAEKLLEVGLRCASPEDRPPPEMPWVAGKVSKAYVESRTWARQLQHSDGLSSVSVAPR